MASNEYHFVTRWRVPGTIEEVSEILGDAMALPRWWPAVYLDVTRLEAAGPDGTGGAYALLTQGWLPYRLRWSFRVTEERRPHRLALEAWGDFVGHGAWTFAQDGDTADVTYDWRIRADKPLLRLLSPLLKPMFAANHEWAMRTGERSLRLEMARRRAATPAEGAAVPAPPPPTRWGRARSASPG